MRDDSILPDLGASDVLVRTHAVGVNPLDMRVSFVHFCFLIPVFQILDLSVFYMFKDSL